MRREFLAIFGFLLLSGNTVFPQLFQDEDLDGVEDSRDKCPGTPILVLVDKDGCPIEEAEIYKKKKRRKFYLRVGAGFFSEKGETTTYSIASVAYSYKGFYTSFTVRYFISDPVRDPALGDSSLFVGYSKYFLKKKLYVFPGIRFRLPTGDKDYSSRKVYYTPSVVISYIFDNNFDIFTYTSYTIRNEDRLKDTLTFSLGGGYQFKKAYTSLSVDFSESAVRDDFNRYLTAFLLYNITKKYYITLTYSFGLNPEATDHSGTIKLGIRF